MFIKKYLFLKQRLFLPFFVFFSISLWLLGCSFPIVAQPSDWETHSLVDPQKMMQGRESLAVLLSLEIHPNAPYLCKVAFASMILNRIRSPLFADTIHGVILEHGAFRCVQDGRYFHHTPDEESLCAARDALLGADPTGGALYCFEAVQENEKRRPYMEKVFAIDRYVFYR